MEPNPYLKDVKQTNGRRVWENPLINIDFQIPTRRIELFIKNLPNNLFELDILPHFERFGPIYQFRLLVDYDNCNRGFAYLIYFHEKSALFALDAMPYFVIQPGTMLEVERSQERSHLLALNIPSSLQNNEIETSFRQLYAHLTSVQVSRKNVKSDGTCNAVLAFPDHPTALNAKRWSGVGSVNIWNRNIKILWARSDQIVQSPGDEKEAKHVLVHNVPEFLDSNDFGGILCQHLTALDIVSIRPMQNDWLVEFTHTNEAYKIFTALNGKAIGGQRVTTEWVTPQRLNVISFFADFEFELRCMCIANYWDPPIFIYGRIVQFTQTQMCSVLIKNNRKNQFTTFFIEMFYEDLVDIHARVCEVLVLAIMQIRELPSKNIVIKCCKEYATVVGAIPDLNVSSMQPATVVFHEPVFIYMQEVYNLSKMNYQLIESQHLHNDIYKEYQMILKEKNVRHQFISGMLSDGNLLGCIDPIYRHGKPLKYGMESHHMIFALCDDASLSNINTENFAALQDIGCIRNRQPLRFKLDRVEMVPLDAVQRPDVHYTYRPFIEFNIVDTYASINGPSTHIPQWLAAADDQQALEEDVNNFTSAKIDAFNFNFEEFANSLM